MTVNGRSVKVTQITFPESINAAVYATSVYASRLSSELVTPSGNAAAGYSASYQVGVTL